MARSIEVQADLDDDAVLLADTTVDADDSMAEIRTPRSRRYVEDFTDGSTLFPWADMPFFIVSTVDAELKALLKKRITAAGGTVVRRIAKARIIIIPYEPAPEVLAALADLPAVDDASKSIVKPHWVLRTFFDGYAEDIDKCQSRPLWEMLRVAVADLGDDWQRLDVMIALERNGALVVDFDDCTLCVVPSGHPFLEHRPSRYKDKQRFCDPTYVFKTLGVRRRIPAPKMTAPARKTIPPPRTAQPSARKSASTREGPPLSALGRRVAAGTRQEFTSEDRHNLARYLADACPGQKGRTSKRLYKLLVISTLQGQGIGSRSWAWTERHPAEGWRQHYRTYSHKPWKDGTVLNDMVEEYFAAGIDADLNTTDERRAAHRRGQSAYEQRRSAKASQPSSPNVPLRKMKGHSATRPSSPAVPLRKTKRPRARESSDDEYERVQANKVQARKVQKVSTKAAQTSRTSSASDDAFVDDELSE